MKFFRFLVLSFIIVVVSGCSSALKMGVTKNTQEIQLSEESLLLISIDLKNEHSIHYQPKARVLLVEIIGKDSGKKNRKSSKRKKGRQRFSGGDNENSVKIYYQFDNEGTTISDQGNRYLVRAILKPGKYVIRGVHGGSGTFPFAGHFFMPRHSSIEVPPSSIVYLGKIVGTVRERKDDEFRAGSLFPLIDQAATGFSTGTFDITIVDAFEDDIKEMKTLFPALQKKRKIEKQLLSEFDRKFAQKWWDNH